MILETARLVLRPLVLEDHKDIQRHFPHWEIVKYLSKNAIKWPYPEDGAEKFLKNIALPAMARGDDWYWGLTLKENPGEVIGVIHLRRDTAAGNRGLWIAKEYQNGGYMKEALEAVNDHAFSTLGFDRLIIKNAADNEASRRLKLKTGAEILETRPASHYLGGSGAQEVWQLTAEKWQDFKAMRDFAKAAACAAKDVYCKAETYLGFRRVNDLAPDFADAARRRLCAPPKAFRGFAAAMRG